VNRRDEVVARLDAEYQEPMVMIHGHCQLARQTLLTVKHRYLYAMRILFGDASLSVIDQAVDDVIESLDSIDYEQERAGEMATRIAKAEEERDRANAAASDARRMLASIRAFARDTSSFDSVSIVASIDAYLTGAGELER
jgi:hypothetical protein